MTCRFCNISAGENERFYSLGTGGISYTCCLWCLTLLRQHYGTESLVASEVPAPETVTEDDRIFLSRLNIRW